MASSTFLDELNDPTPAEPRLAEGSDPGRLRALERLALQWCALGDAQSELAALGLTTGVAGPLGEAATRHFGLRLVREEERRPVRTRADCPA